MKAFLKGVALLVVAALAGCPGDIMVTDGGAGGGTAMLEVDAGCEGVAPRALDDVYDSLLGAQAMTGCAASGCHGTGAGSLTFTSARSLYDATVGRNAFSNRAHKLIEPGNPNLSEFYLRLLAQAPSRMPLGGPFFDDAQAAAVAGWICAGAPPPSGASPDAGRFDAGVDAGVADAGVLVIATFAPASGVVGTAVTLGGVGFSTTALQNVVRFGTVAASVDTASPTSLVVRVPMMAVTAPIEVQVGGLTSRTATDFVVEQGNPVPAVSSLSPDAAVVGSADLEVTARGQGFVDGGVVRLDGSPLVARFIDAAAFSFTLPASALTSAGGRQVVITNPAPGGGASAPITFLVLNPAPTVASALPAGLITGGAATMLTLTGTGFVPGSQVRFDQALVSSTLRSATTMEAQVPTVTTDGPHTLTVTNPPPGGGTSMALTVSSMTISTPVITGLSPSPAPAGQAFTLTVTGANFTCSGMGPRVLVAGVPIAPASCAATQLSVAVPSTAAGPVVVQVRNPNMDLSNQVTLQVVAPNPVPSVSALMPASVNSGGPGATIQVSGSGFVAASVATFNGSTRPTVFVDASTLTFSLSQTDLATPGGFQVGVNSPSPGGGSSNTATLTVVATNPLPTLTSLTPSSFVVGSAATQVTASGAGFVSASTVSFNGMARAATFVSATELRFTLSATDLATPGTFPVVVTSPPPGGGSTGSVSVSIGSPVPAVSGLTPCGVVAGTGPHTLQVAGSGFTAASTVRFNGTALTTTFVSATRLDAVLPAALVSTAPALGVAPVVTVNTPAPGGGTSNAVVFGVAKLVSTLAANVQPLFTSSCGGMGCHAGATPADNLSLVAGQSRAQLVGAASVECVGKVRVMACNPTRAGSVLADKILATAMSPACGGNPMPRMAPLTTAEKQLIIDWIAQGAPP